MNLLKKQMIKIKEERLENGLRIHFSDESNRYFGDYHRICVVATIHCNLKDLPATNPDEEAFRCEAVAMFGEELSVSKRFERMGVSSADVEATRNALVDDFLMHTSPYLSRPEYPHSLVAAEMKKHATRRYYG